MSYLLLKDCAGKDRGWKVNMMTIEIWSKSIDESAFSSTSTYAGVYAGLVANCKVKQEEPDFTFEEICDYVDKMNESDEGLAVLEEVKRLFEESQYYIKLVNKLKEQVAELTEDIDKKKEQQMTA